MSSMQYLPISNRPLRFTSDFNLAIFFYGRHIYIRFASILTVVAAPSIVTLRIQSTDIVDTLYNDISDCNMIIPAEMTCYRFKPPLPSPAEERVSTPEPKQDEVLLKVLASGICHSDVGIFDPTSLIHHAVAADKPNGFTCGHEGAGTIFHSCPMT